MVNKAQFDRVNRYIAKGLADGLKVAAEGAIADGVPTGGYFVKPTLFSAPSHDSTLLTEEIFGPVLVALPFDTEADAIRLANATDYGLLGAVWTENGGRQQRIARGIKCGQVYINGFGAGRRRGTAVWRRQEKRPRTREGLYRAGRNEHDQNDHPILWRVIAKLSGDKS